MTTTGIGKISKERQEQLTKHKWDDTTQTHDALASAARFCLSNAMTSKRQPLNREHYPYNWTDWFLKKIIAKRERMTDTEFALEMYTIAGALTAAAIDKLQVDTLDQPMIFGQKGYMGQYSHDTYNHFVAAYNNIVSNYNENINRLRTYTLQKQFDTVTSKKLQIISDAITALENASRV